MAIITVGIVTFNAAENIEMCLSAILLQRRPPDEVIIVDNGSVDETLLQVTNVLKMFKGTSFKVLKNDQNNIASARAKIIKEAAGQWVAMTDPDCLVPEKWLYSYEQYVDVHPEVRVIGSGNCVVVRSRFLKALHMMSQFFFGHMNSTQLRYDFPTGPVDQIPTCNIMYHKESVLSVGSFNPIYTKVCEDVELNHRLKKAGMQITFLHNNNVMHDHNRTLWQWIFRLFEFGKGHWHVITQSPGYFSWRQGLPVFCGIFIGAAFTLGGAFFASLMLLAAVQFICCFRVARKEKWEETFFLFYSLCLGQLAYIAGNAWGLFLHLFARLNRVKN